ncbi:NAD(P)/FAD-dependent oxidoreductase [Brevundimonas sp. TWP1-2-1b1]|uniref:NAD(P)/FAD-dependent oxidoreductase n=1 Tax=unclassified Brevundimonas TaxID=2622653 RepID=UPI003CF2A666
MERVVIIGGGLAAVSAAKTLRTEGFEGALTMVSEEPCLPYDRPPLSKAVLQGAADSQSICLLTEEARQKLEIELRINSRAETIDRVAQMVRLSTGDSLSYDRLLIATGSRARILDGPFAGKANVFYLRTIADAERLRAQMVPGRCLLSIGAGWIGLEVAATARKGGMKAVVVELAQMLCGRSLPMEVGMALGDVHRINGTEVYLNTSIRAVGGEGRVESVTLSNGETLAVDIVVIGIGAVANDSLAEEAGLETDNGIVVDQFLRTTDPLIFAAGDVAAQRVDGGRPVRRESWANAQDQAAAAARNMLGHDKLYSINTWFWSDQYDLNIQMIGVNPAEEGAMLLRKDEGRSFTRFSVVDERLAGAICFDRPREMAVIRRLISKGYSVTDDALTTVRDLRELL